MIDEKLYEVTIVIKLTTTIDFAPREIEEDEHPINQLDAISNAVGSMPAEAWDDLKDGFGGEFSTEMEFYVKEL